MWKLYALFSFICSMFLSLIRYKIFKKKKTNKGLDCYYIGTLSGTFRLFLIFILYAPFTLKLSREFYCNKLVPDKCAFLVIMQHVGVIPFRSFRTIYQSHLQWSIIHELNWILDLWILDQKSVPKIWYGITTTHCIVARKNTVIVYFAPESWNFARWQLFAKFPN